MAFESPALVDTETGRTSNELLRSFTDQLMTEIARLAGRPYDDEPVVREAAELDVLPDEAASGSAEVDLGPAEASAS
jgi:hypothetical protein